jgi:hypothetical protein
MQASVSAIVSGELRPFDAQAFKSGSIDYAIIEPDEQEAEG